MSRIPTLAFMNVITMMWADKGIQNIAVRPSILLCHGPMSPRVDTIWSFSEAGFEPSMTKHVLRILETLSECPNSKLQVSSRVSGEKFTLFYWKLADWLQGDDNLFEIFRSFIWNPNKAFFDWTVFVWCIIMGRTAGIQRLFLKQVGSVSVGGNSSS